MSADFQFSAFVKLNKPIQTLVINRARVFPSELLLRSSRWKILKMRNFSNVVAHHQTKTSKLANRTVLSQTF